MSRPRLLPALLAAALLFAPLAALAGPSAQDKAAAKTAWTKGKQLDKAGQLDEALVALREAVQADPKVQYQLDLARALVKKKAYLEALATIEAIAGSSEPNTQKAKSAAAGLKKEIEPKVPSLKIEVKGSGASEALVTVDGERAEVGRELPLDPGKHSVRGRAGDGPEVSEEVTLAESEDRVLTLTVEKGAAEKKAAKEESSGGGNMAPAAVLYGVGGAGIAVGVVLGVLAFNKTGEVEELCGGTVCPPEYADDVALAQDYGTGSTVAFAVGGLCVAAGIILTFTVGLDSSEPDEKKSAGVTVTPYFGPNELGVTGTF